MSEPWNMFKRALPHTLRVCAAFDEPDQKTAEPAYHDAIRILREQGDEKLVMMAWARTAGLAGIDGPILFERELAAPAPEPWVTHAAAMVDAGVTGLPDQIGLVLIQAATALGGDVGDVGQALASITADWMRIAGGARMYNTHLRQHVKVYDAGATPAEAAVIEPASLAVAATAAGEPVFGKSIIDYHCERGPETALALVHVWLRLMTRIFSTTLEPALLVRPGDEGFPERHISEPVTDLEKTGAFLLDAVTGLAGSDEAGTARVLRRVENLPPGEWQAMSGVLAYSIGSYYRGIPKN